MIVRAFLPSDIPTRDGWLTARGLHRPMSRVPAVAFIVEGVACGFLVQTDHDFAVLDDVVTNVVAAAVDRHAALDGILDAIESKARSLGIQNIIVNASDPSIVARCHARRMIEHVGVRHFIRKI